MILLYNLHQDSAASTELFRETLERMARKMIQVDKVVYWGELLPVGKPQNRNTPPPSTLYPLPSAITELWINSTFHPEIKQLCNHYPKAQVCYYGDGPGIYFTEKCRFIFPQRKEGNSAWNTLKKIVKMLLKLPLRAMAPVFLPRKRGNTENTRNATVWDLFKPQNRKILNVKPQKDSTIQPFNQPTPELRLASDSTPSTHSTAGISTCSADRQFRDTFNPLNLSTHSPLTLHPTGYFLFPHAFEEIPDGFAYTEVAAETFKTIFEEIKSVFDFSFLDEAMEKNAGGSQYLTIQQFNSSTIQQFNNSTFSTPSTISTTKKKPQPTLTFFLTANLSEAKRMSEENELKAYTNVLKKQAGANDLILIKPHPREGREKIAKLKTQLNRQFQNVAVINTSVSQYIPFELFILHLLENYYPDLEALQQKVQIITTSTSCLSLAKLYGLRCRIGLEEADIRRFFQPERVEDRLAHNLALQQLVDQILSPVLE